MSKVLELVFKDAKGKTKTFNINEPRDNVTKAEAETAMKNIITANVFRGTCAYHSRRAAGLTTCGYRNTCRANR